MDKVSLPKMESKEIEFLDDAQQKSLKEHLPDTTSGRALRFTLDTGLRASELCGLQWQDVDEDGYIKIRRGLQKVRSTDGSSEHKIAIAPPKTKAGQRPIPVFLNAKAILEKQRIEQVKQRLKAGDAWAGGEAGKGETYIFASEIGIQQTETTFRVCYVRHYMMQG